MSKPIPDKVLRVFANGPYAGDSRAWHDAADEIEKIDLARELLALRDAASEMLERYCRLVNCGDCGDWDPETEDEVRALRALLPKESP